MQQLADNLWVKRYPLHFLGVNAGRRVTILRLADEKLLIHSTAAFSAADVEEIRQIGTPTWLVEASRFHDTCTDAGRRVLPEVPFLAPEGFSAARPILPAPPQWAGQIDVCRIEGMPSVQEHVFFHRASRTLIVADLMFNLDLASSFWARILFRYAMGLRAMPAMTPAFRLVIRDRDAFRRSIAEVVSWDFDRLIVGHGEIVETGAKARFRLGLGKLDPGDV